MFEEQFKIETEFGPIYVLRGVRLEKNQEQCEQEFAEIIAKILIENEKQNPCFDSSETV